MTRLEILLWGGCAIGIALIANRGIVPEASARFAPLALAALWCAAEVRRRRAGTGCKAGGQL